MGQPTPPGDNVPLYDGLGADWNDVLGGFPEDKRAEFAPLIKQKLDSQLEQYKPLEAYADFHKSGIAPEQIGSALNLYSIIENNPKQVYDTIGKALNLTPQEVQQAAETMEETMEDDDPRIRTLQQQVDTLTQIALAQREKTLQEQTAAEQDKALEKEFNQLRKKYGDDIDEEEILMRMVHKNLTAEQAYDEYSKKVSQLRQTRPAPMLLGSGGGAVPRKTINPTELDSAGTKNLVTQMLQHAQQQDKN